MSSKYKYRVDAPSEEILTKMPFADVDSTKTAANAIARLISNAKGRLTLDFSLFQVRYEPTDPTGVAVYINDGGKYEKVSSGTAKIIEVLGEFNFEETVIRYLPRLILEKENEFATGNHKLYLTCDGIEFRLSIDKAPDED